jgi:hypothetical protein
LDFVQLAHLRLFLQVGENRSNAITLFLLPAIRNGQEIVPALEIYTQMKPPVIEFS